MLQILGSSNQMRAQILLTQIQSVDSRIKSLCTAYIYLIDTDDAEVKPSLSELLNPDKYELDYANLKADEHLFFVLPREGTITPWSSKCTDIAQICNINVDRIELGTIFIITSSEKPSKLALSELYDCMTHKICNEIPVNVFSHGSRKKTNLVSVDQLEKVNKEWGLALSADEIQHLSDFYIKTGRSATDAELVGFAQLNSEHCRHKIFKAKWFIDGVEKEHSLMQMIQNTMQKYQGDGVLSAYVDNAAVFKGPTATKFMLNPESKCYETVEEEAHFVAKVETHNHPTAISPYPGAATGSGGEIRDEGAVGQGSQPKAGLVGFITADLCIPGYVCEWEQQLKADHVSSAFEIMLQAPLGAADFNNEFGRPGICGFFRTLSMKDRGYYKPVMVAGGVGSVRPQHIHKKALHEGMALAVLGGPAMLIGLGGGAASSMSSETERKDLDYASVQRENPEMQRRCQQVINTFTSMKENPIDSIHDVGAGGLSNALAELVNDAELGAEIDIGKIPCADSSMSPMEIWCNESQERYVMCLKKEQVKVLQNIAERERCPFAVVGLTTKRRHLLATFEGEAVVDVPMDLLFYSSPSKMTVKSCTAELEPFSLDFLSLDLTETVKKSAELVLQLPSVASKAFLITIGDRSVGGHVVQEQMVGPWQVPVSDVAVTRSTLGSKSGEAMAMGERPLIALVDAAASAKMAVCEAITNLAAADIPSDTSGIRLSANWMAAAKHGNEGAKLYEAVEAVGLDLCPLLGIPIPVGKDSLSMHIKWQNHSVTAPVTLVVTAYAAVESVFKTWTPQLQRTSSDLVLIDLSGGHFRLGGSALAQVYGKTGGQAPQADALLVKQFVKMMNHLRRQNLVMAYHDRSDGGLLTTVCEMAFAGRTGISIDLSSFDDGLAALFNEELGVVIQTSRLSEIKEIATEYGLSIYKIGHTVEDKSITIKGNGFECNWKTSHLQRIWTRVSYEMQKRRDFVECAEMEYQLISDENDPGLMPFEYKMDYPVVTRKGKVAILREQGVNGHVEMAYAFHLAGFEAVDVHMTDLLSNKVNLAEMQGIAACGGFSYGDVLGAAQGWAHSILRHQNVRKAFSDFFNRKDGFVLGVCNGCQLLSLISELIPGCSDWPKFEENASMRFEARTCMIAPSSDIKSPWLHNIAGKLRVPVAHGQGRASHSYKAAFTYVDNYGNPTVTYPLNPNGSPNGLAGICSPDGRVLAMMPHPERLLDMWLPLFLNARSFV